MKSVFCLPRSGRRPSTNGPIRRFVSAAVEHGAIGKTKYNDYKKDKIKRLGDWQCSYCSVAGHCLKEARPELQYLITDLQGLLSDTSAEVEIG